MILGEISNKKSKNKFNKLEDSFREVHKDKYDYSKAIYKGMCIKIEIWCNIHREYFWQTPEKHLSKQGCPKCGRVSISLKQSLSFTDFIEKANLLHKHKYQYSSENFKNGNSLINITCPIHGCFTQKANAHLALRGCPKCGSIARTLANTKPFSKFKIEADHIHNNKYTYIEDSYISTHIKMKIVCPKHGEFLQTPKAQLKGHGCVKCIEGTQYQAYYEAPTLLYYIKFTTVDKEYFKIGITKQNIKKRYNSLYKYPHIKGYEILNIKEFPNGHSAYTVEQEIVSTFKDLLTKDSVLVGNGNSEVFDKDIYPDIQHHFI